MRLHLLFFGHNMNLVEDKLTLGISCHVQSTRKLLKLNKAGGCKFSDEEIYKCANT